MLNRFFCLNRRASLRVGLLSLCLGILHEVLAHWWAGYVHLTDHARSISVDFVSGLAVGLGGVLIVYGFGSDGDNASEDYTGTKAESRSLPSSD